MRAAVSAIPTGIAVSLIAAALLSFVAFPLLPGLAGMMGGFMTFAGAPAFLPTIATTGAVFFPVPLMFFNTAITIAASAVNGGHLAVAKHTQQVDHAHNDARISRLEAREQMIEEALAPAHGRATIVDSIIRQGPRPLNTPQRAGTLTVDTILRDGASQSHAAAEEAREAASAQKGPTLH